MRGNTFKTLFQFWQGGRWNGERERERERERDKSTEIKLCYWPVCCYVKLVATETSEWMWKHEWDRKKKPSSTSRSSAAAEQLMISTSTHKRLACSVTLIHIITHFLATSRRLHWLWMTVTHDGHVKDGYVKKCLVRHVGRLNNAAGNHAI